MYESQQGPEICDVSPCIWDKLGLRLRNYSMVTNLNLRVSQYDLLTKYSRALCTSLFTWYREQKLHWNETNKEITI